MDIKNTKMKVLNQKATDVYPATMQFVVGNWIWIRGPSLIEQYYFMIHFYLTSNMGQDFFPFPWVASNKPKSLKVNPE